MSHDLETEQTAEMNRIETILYRMFGRPSGLLGRLGGKLLRGKGKITEWTLSLLAVQPTDHVLEVGFGPGISVELAAKATPDGFVAGIDYSQVMVEMARKHNAAAIRTGDVELRYGPAADLPYENERFENVFSINSMQVWSDARVGVREIRRVLKPGGTVALTFTPIAKQSREELRTILSDAGFDDVQFHDHDDGFCATANR